ncbi:MAG: diguanylate cyclase [Janthinobacterium lividum]
MNGTDLRTVDLDRAASLSERCLALSVAIALAMTFLFVFPFAERPEWEIAGFIPLFAGAMFVIDIVRAVLLFSKGVIGRKAAPITLATAYLFAATMIIPYLAAFPGALMTQSLLGTSGTSMWVWCFWHAGFAAGVVRYVVQRQATAQPRAIIRAIIATVSIVLALWLLATVGREFLPFMPSGASSSANVFPLALGVPVMLLNVTALVFVGWRLRLRTAEDLWLTIAMLAACVDVGLTLQAGSRFSLGWYAGRTANLVTSLIVLVSLFSDVLELYAEVARTNLKLNRLAHVDGLTGLANRRHLDLVIETEFARARRDKRALSVVMIDVDYFKIYNDKYGHQEGDRCLRQIAAALRDSVQRPGDLVARYGGEEFALILPATDLRGAFHVAEMLRTAIRSLALPHGASPFEVVTVSVGVASIVPRTEDKAEAALAQADRALYRAKQGGRDQTCYETVDDVATTDTPLHIDRREAEPAGAALADQGKVLSDPVDPSMLGQDALGWLGLLPAEQPAVI